MDYKKKYKEALSWIKDVYPTFEGAVKEDAEHFFPELKESEDERIRKRLIEEMRHFQREAAKESCDADFDFAKSAIAWLEKQGQKPAEWSDENKNIIDGIIEYLECFNDYDCGDEPYEEYYERFEKYIKFMESLKPQSQWKPSKEQMKGIDCAIKTLRHQLNVEDKRLNSLYEQLKKL